MWLPPYSLVFLSIGQLMTDTYAVLYYAPASRLWRPESHAPVKYLAGATTGSFLTLPHEQAIAAFKTESATLITLSQKKKKEPSDLLLYSVLEKTAYKHLYQVVNYLLLHQSMSPEHLEQWCRALANAAIERNGGAGPASDSIAFAFYTLQLRHRRNAHLTEALRCMVSRILPQPSGLLSGWSTWARWSHELRRPYLGFTPGFVSWENHLKEVSMDEPRLKPLGKAIHENDTGYITKNLKKIIGEIFSIEPANDLSAETRVASLAVLFHLLKNSDEAIKKEAAQLMNR
ncbi:hypothetical protein PtB15_1B613 [Puccinia triticina]|nr:hypothetical protein PtB15_1B613 [Puccinia triticina]